MLNVQVCLVSDQPIPNLTTIVQFQPDLVILLYTEDRKPQKDRLERVVGERGIRVEARLILPYGLANVIKTCEGVIQDCPDCRVSLNITGGTKIGTLGAFQAFSQANLPIYYVNTKDNQILQVAPTELTLPIEVKISIKEYLSAYGFTMERQASDRQRIQLRRPLTEALRNLAITSEWAIGNLNDSFRDSLPRNVKNPRFPLEIRPTDEGLLLLIPLMEEQGIVRRGHDGSLMVDTMDNVNYLRGFWFEEFVFMAAIAAGADEVALNVEGTWDATGRTATKNEFDVMVAKGNRLFFISCKTSNPNRKEGSEAVGKEYLYELDSLGDQALGLFGKKMLASARPVKDDYLRQRARVMKIDLVDRNDLHNLKGKLRHWLSR